MRPTRQFLLAGAAALTIVSCSQDGVSPARKPAPVISRNPALASLVIPRSTDFVIPAQGGSVSLMGLYRLTFPANAVCDPNAQDTRDGYAAADWDSPCTLLGADLNVHATLKWSNGALWIDFSPALRFNPATEVTLSTDLLAPLVQYYSNDGQDGSGGLSSHWGIGYAPSLDGTPVVDAAFDPSAATRINFTSGVLSRRVKHFSGYLVTTGEPCELSPSNPDCLEFPPDGQH